MAVFVYILSDPRSGEIRYVGMTRKTIDARLRRHLVSESDQRNGRTYRARWVQSLKRLGLRPHVALVQAVPGDSGGAAERYWIAYFRSVGCPLTNGSDGGDGSRGYVMSDAHRKAVGHAATAKWQKWRDEGRRISDETRERLRIKALGRKASDEAKAKMRGPRKPLTTEHREKIRLALIGRPKSPEHRKKTLKQYKVL